MKLILLLCSFALCATLRAQVFRYPQLTPVAEKVPELIPKDWHLLDSTYGDLNRDGAPDLALVLQYRDSVAELRPDSSVNHGRPRVLVVYFSGGRGWMRALQHNTFITREGEGGMSSDAYDSLRISRGVLEVRCQFVRSHAAWKFRWQEGEFMLIGATSNGVSGGAFYGFDANFLTRRARIEKGPLDEKGKISFVRLPQRKLRRLAEMDMIFRWEVLPDQYL